MEKKNRKRKRERERERERMGKREKECVILIEYAMVQIKVCCANLSN